MSENFEWWVDLEHSSYLTENQDASILLQHSISDFGSAKFVIRDEIWLSLRLINNSFSEFNGFWLLEIIGVQASK